ncbi:MAG: hypothetical protein IPN07_16800 [Dehalococcoidia bacterium]|nr:hypothetical protein [Dehalococcoidia bacterium]
MPSRRGEGSGPNEEHETIPTGPVSTGTDGQGHGDNRMETECLDGIGEHAAEDDGEAGVKVSMSFSK